MTMGNLRIAEGHVNKVVARYSDGRVVKGTTIDFSPDAEKFHILDSLIEENARKTRVETRELKALFYVKDFEGDPYRQDHNAAALRPGPGEQGVSILFKDGEVMVGTTPRYRIQGTGYFVQPADPNTNNKLVFVFTAATRGYRVVC